MFILDVKKLYISIDLFIKILKFINHRLLIILIEKIYSTIQLKKLYKFNLLI